MKKFRDFKDYSKMEKLLELRHENSRNLHLLLFHFAKFIYWRFSKYLLSSSQHLNKQIIAIS